MLKAEKQIRETITKHNLISRGDHLVIGLSGGPDSVCLFHVLLGMSKELDLKIHTVHLNHQFRPGAAERDQRYVEELSAKSGVDYHGFVVDCNKLARELGMTSEEAGRKARYDAFFEVARDIAEEIASEPGKLMSNSSNTVSKRNWQALCSNVKIVVAQNAEDQAETILFRILRGTGTDGLAGMAYKRLEKRECDNKLEPEEIKQAIEFKVVRPLLDTRRADIEAYCKAKDLKPVIDHTNNEMNYARNRIRLDLLPYIEEKYNSGIKSGLIRLGKIASADKDYFWQETNRAFEELRSEGKRNSVLASEEMSASDDVLILDREGLAMCHEAIRHRVMLKAFDKIGLSSDVTAERLEAADEIIAKKQGTKTVEFPHGYRITVAKGKVYFKRS